MLEAASKCDTQCLSTCMTGSTYESVGGNLQGCMHKCSCDVSIPDFSTAFIEMDKAFEELIGTCDLTCGAHCILNGDPFSKPDIEKCLATTCGCSLMAAYNYNLCTTDCKNQCALSTEPENCRVRMCNCVPSEYQYFSTDVKDAYIKGYKAGHRDGSSIGRGIALFDSSDLIPLASWFFYQPNKHDADFGDDFERGYAKGYEEGKTEGYNEILKELMKSVDMGPFSDMGSFSMPTSTSMPVPSYNSYGDYMSSSSGYHSTPSYYNGSIG